MKSTNLPSAEPRIKKVDVKSLGIKGYDEDNAYPQRIISLVNASSTTKQAIGIYAKFIAGGGFADKAFYKTKINRKGLTPDKLLKRVAKDYATFQGFALLVNWNALFQIDSIFYVPFENVRMGAKDTEFEGKYALCSDWDGNPKKAGMEWKYSFNSIPDIIQAQVDAAGGWDSYPGQVYYVSADFEVYPLASCDAVVEPMQAEIASDRTSTKNLKNNFALKNIFVSIGEAESEEERDGFIENMKTFIGPDGEQVMLCEAPNKDSVPQIMSVENSLNDKIFQYTDEKSARKIIRHYLQPAILHSITDGGYFNQQQLQDSMDYYNGITKDERILIEEVFHEIFSLYREDINPTKNYQPIPLSYFEIADQADSDRLLIDVLGVGGTQALQGILADTATTPKQKKSALKIIFGLSEEDANELSGYDPNNERNDATDKQE